MSLILLLSAAWAGTTVWLRGEPAPAIAPDDTHLTAAQVAPPAGWTPADDRVLEHLQAELQAVAPMKDVFDGELQIMRRLDAAIADVGALRAADRDLLWRALVFEGYAVDRYFQQSLSTDPAAAPYRSQQGARTEVRPWVDAIAIDPDRAPTRADLPDEAQFVAFQELRARQLLATSGTIIATGMADDQRLLIDGRAATVDRMAVPPGRHYVSLVSGEAIAARMELELGSGDTQRTPHLATPDDLQRLADRLDRAPGSLVLDDPITARLAPLAAPVTLALGDRKAPLRYTVQGNAALRVDAAPKTAGGDGPLLRVDLGAAWINDEGFLLQNLDQGAPATRATVNAFAPLLSLGGEARLGPLAAGAGLDLALPIGDFHTLPTGADRAPLRARAYPHLALGLPAAQLTAGFWSPFHLGLGARAHLPLPKQLEVTAGYTYGIGLSRTRDDGSTFTPDRAQTAWAALGYRFARAPEAR